MNEKKKKALKHRLMACEGYTERSFETMILAFDTQRKVAACKEARAILQVGLAKAIAFVNEWWYK